MNAGEFFGKYIGILGVLALIFATGYVLAPFMGVMLPDGYTEITMLIVGSYAGKNGSMIIKSIRGG